MVVGGRLAGLSISGAAYLQGFFSKQSCLKLWRMVGKGNISNEQHFSGLKYLDTDYVNTHMTIVNSSFWYTGFLKMTRSSLYSSALQSHQITVQKSTFGM